MPDTQAINLTKNLNLIKNANPVINVTVADPTLLVLPFAHQQIDLAAASITLQGGDKLTFKGSGADVNFHLSADAKAGAGVFLEGHAIASALALDTDIALDIPPDPAKHYTMLRSGFDFAASMNGSVALGAGGSATLGLDASANAGFAVIRQFDDEAENGLAELGEVANSWKLPVHVNTDADLEPGTWLVAEVGGAIGLKLGVQYGFDYNWIKQLQLGGLNGDVGLRLHAGINAALGLNASGTHVVVVSRSKAAAPADRVVRLQLFRRAQRGWSFALNAGLDVSADLSKLPKKVDDFIAAVFGVHGAQIISDLHVVEQWTGDESTLGGLLAAAGIKRAQTLLTDITGINAETLFNQAHDLFHQFLQKWDALDHKVASLLLKFIGNQVDLKPIKELADQIANGPQAAIDSFLGDKLKQFDFFQTPEGQYLEALATGGLVGLLDPAIFAEAQTLATQTLAVLDGSAIEKLLGNLQSKVIKALNLQPLVDLAHDIDQQTFKSLDDLLKAKLAAFLDKKLADLGLQDVDKIRVALGKLLGLRQKFYEKAKDALAHEYKFNFATTYQSQTTKTALLDLAFDFAQGDAATLTRFLHDAVAGHFDQILVESVAGISINKARLTHGLKRQKHTELNMPFFSTASDELLTSDASLDVQTENGRVFAYDLRAQDIVKARVKTRTQRSSTLTVGAHFGVRPGAGVRFYPDLSNEQAATLTYAYEFRQAVKQMTAAHFTTQAGKYIDAYFTSAFAQGAGTEQAWLANITSKGQGAVLGNTLLSLDINVPSSVGASWFTAPGSNALEDQRVKMMKHNLLVALQKLIPFYFFSDLSKFNNVGFDTTSLLVYQAAQPTLAELATGNFSAPQVRPMLFGIIDRTAQGSDNSPLGKVLDYWSARLNAAKHPKQSFFQNNANNRQQIIQITKGNLINFISLLITTNELHSSAESARKNILQFLATAPNQPEVALEQLAEFGAQIVSAFNNIDTVYGDDALRPLSTIAFLEAARALATPNIVPASVNALLDVTLLNIDPATLDDNAPTPAQIIYQDRLPAIGALPNLLQLLPDTSA